MITKGQLKAKLQQNPALNQQFRFEVLEREAIINENEDVENSMSLAQELTVEAWLRKFE